MDQNRFDALTRSWSEAASRRSVLGGILATMGHGVLLPGGAAAKRTKTHRKRKKPKKNAFGCLNVGQRCRGKNRKCCSGRCQGKKPKKGEKDKSRCVGHDASTCLSGQTFPICGGGGFVSCTSSAGLSGGVCATTTGNAAYCAYVSDCFPCKKDTDCQAVCGPQAACIACAGSCPEAGGTICAGVAACALPGAEPL
jgi:hypothetical protein